MAAFDTQNPGVRRSNPLPNRFMSEQPASSETPIHVSIGILAHNEEERIVAMLESVYRQDVFSRFRVDLLVIANGCKDQTVPLARGAMEAATEIWQESGISKVEVVEQAGKANAWNLFVHEFSARDAELLMVMDADICLLQPDTLSRLVVALQENQRAVVSVDQPIKDIAMAANPGPLARMFLSATPKVDPDNATVCGHLYCVRSEDLRGFRLPIGMQIEDGFIRAMLLTNRFTAPEDLRRIVLAPDASHSFESVKGVGEAVRHERWIVGGSIINMMLFERFTSADNADADAGRLMDDWREKDPTWLASFVREEIAARGWNLLPRDWWTRRWTRLRGLSLFRKLKKLPAACAASALDLIVFVAAMRDVRSGRAFNYWGR